MAESFSIINIGNRIVNNWLYRIDDGYVLVDTGYANGYARFLGKLKRNKISLEEIKFVFLTHAHDDHAGFLNALLTDCEKLRVVMGEKAPAGLFRGQNSFDGGCTTKKAKAFCNFMKLFGKGAHRFPKVEQRFQKRFIVVREGCCEDTEKLLCGKVIATPGHTACSISLLLQDGTLFCGDAAMNGFPAQKNVTIWAENADDFAASWEKMIALRPRCLYPGHGMPFAVTRLQKHLPFAKNLILRPLLSTE